MIDRFLTEEAQRIIWEAYDNLQVFSENFGANDYAEAVKELEQLEEELQTIRMALSECPAERKDLI